MRQSWLSQLLELQSLRRENHSQRIGSWSLKNKRDRLETQPALDLPLLALSLEEQDQEPRKLGKALSWQPATKPDLSYKRTRLDSANNWKDR